MSFDLRRGGLAAAIGVGGADVRLKLEGLASLARDLAAPAEATRAAA